MLELVIQNSCIAFSWLGLLLSKSRSSMLIALLTLGIYGLFKMYQRSTPRIFWMRLSLGIVITCLGIPLLINIFKPEYLSHIVEVIGQILSKNNHFLNSATQEFGGRPELFKAAFFMFSDFPWMGIGQGEFYRQSSNEVFSHSFLLSAWGGENAHNYFLQTLAETGLIGVTTFALVILAPFFMASKKSDLKIGYIALGSLFLGNLYSHAFLVRENLLLGALFLGLLYSHVPGNFINEGRISATKLSFGKDRLICLMLFIGVSLFFGTYELYKSFGKEPFRYGSECFVNRPVTKDGWTSGLFEMKMPKGSSEAVMILDPLRPDVSPKHPLT